MPAIPLILAGAAALIGGGFFIDKAGEGVEDASNGIIKLALVGGIGLLVLKKAKVI